jgi:competence/damage-inducible protein CinA-like protein
MTAEIISIGDELLIGQVVNTNASWMAQQLHAIGISIRQIVAISDDKDEIRTALDNAFPRTDLILVTGGLGPTRDDITKHTLCDYFGAKMVIHEPSLEMITKFFAARGLGLTEHNRKQAEVPDNCIPILNYNGTAPGMWFEKEGKILVSMPGVPFEMEAMMENQILPRLSAKDNNVVVMHKTVQTHGEGESILMEMIREWEDVLPTNFRLAYLPQPGIVRLRLTAFGADRESVASQIESQIASLRRLIPNLIFGYGNETMEEVVGKLLLSKHATLSTAESCTGGYLAHLITSVPGASEYFAGSVIAYANQVKHDLLGVSEDSLRNFGAVSEQVVREMAAAARNRFGTDYALSTSGIAGPDGGTPEKPVGLVWVCLATPQQTISKKFMFGEHRGRNIRRTALEALNLLRLQLL